MYAVIAFERLRQAGYEVTPAEGVPGLWNIEGLARDVTTNQLRALAAKHGAFMIPLAHPVIRIDGLS